MRLLGRNLPNHKEVRIALRAFYGLGHQRSQRLCARLQIHPEALVSDLTEPQVTALSAWLSAPSTTQPPARPALSIPAPPPDCLVLPSSPATDVKGKKKVDMMDNLLIETDLKRNMLADIAHHREIGTYRGKRTAGGYPVRGQNTRSNAKTARKLNRLERRRYTTATNSTSFSSSSSSQSSPFSSSNVLAEIRARGLVW